MTWGQWFLIGVGGLAVALYLAYEVYALINKTPGDTISAFVYMASLRYPVIPFAVGLITGLLAGHFWWPLHHPAK